MKRDFFSLAVGEYINLSRTAWLSMAAFGAVSLAAEFAHWTLGPRLSAIDFMAFVITIMMGLSASYLSAMAMVSRRTNATGFVRFVASTALLTAPIVAGLSVLLFSGPEPAKALIWAGLILLAVGWACLVFAPAWPVAQALSTRWVSPLRVLRGTKGHRWSLLLASSLGGIFSRLVPATTKATSLAEAILYAVGHGLAAVASAILFTSIGVTAWRFASGNDPMLYGDEPRPVGV